MIWGHRWTLETCPVLASPVCVMKLHSWTLDSNIFDFKTLLMATTRSLTVVNAMRIVPEKAMLDMCGELPSEMGRFNG